jgi:DNA-binding NarL/FixJ family response regulator
MGFVEFRKPETGKSDAPTFKLVIADDHPLFRGAISEVVSGGVDRVEMAEAGDFEATAALLERTPDTDLVLLDLGMPGMRGFAGLMYLRAQHPAVPVIIVSAHVEPETIRQAMRFGASGFIPKTLDAETMRSAIRTVLGGDIWTPPDIDIDGGSEDEGARLAARLAKLTPQQVRVLMMLSEGLLNKQIAYELGVSEATVKAHVSAILAKLDVDSRTQAVILACKIGSGHWPAADGAGG